MWWRKVLTSSALVVRVKTWNQYGTITKTRRKKNVHFNIKFTNKNKTFKNLFIEYLQTEKILGTSE